MTRETRLTERQIQGARNLLLLVLTLNYLVAVCVFGLKLGLGLLRPWMIWWAVGSVALVEVWFVGYKAGRWRERQPAK